MTVVLPTILEAIRPRGAAGVSMSDISSSEGCKKGIESLCMSSILLRAGDDIVVVVCCSHVRDARVEACFAGQGVKQ